MTSLSLWIGSTGLQRTYTRAPLIDSHFDIKNLSYGGLQAQLMSVS